MKRRPDTKLSRRAVLAAFVGPGLITSANAQEEGLMTRAIPRSGERLPVIGLGTANVFDVGDDPAGRAARAAVIHALVAAGGKLIDTAPSYGQAEKVIGDLVAEAGSRRAVFLATKLESFDQGSATVELHESRRSLRTDTIDLMQLHNVDSPRQDLALLRAWKERGICRYTGITTTFHGDFNAAEAILRREKPDFLEIDYSIEDREAEKRLLPLAAETGTAVLTAEPFGRGRLFRSVLQRPLPDWAHEFGAATWGQFFIKYLLANPAVTAVIPGTSNPVHMADNLAAGRGRAPDEAERRKMVEFFASLG